MMKLPKIPAAVICLALVAMNQPYVKTFAEETKYPAITDTQEYLAPVQKLCEMSKMDCYKMTGVLPENAESSLQADGTIVVALTDEFGSSVDTYTLNPVTGIGTAENGRDVNLPQTGVCDPTIMLTAVGGVFLLLAGAYAVMCSGMGIGSRE